MQYPYGPPMPPPKKGMGAGMIALIVIGCMFGGCFVLGAIGSAAKKNDGEQARAPSAPQPKSAPAPKAQAVPVTALELFKDYQGNEVAADGRYKGRTLLVTGTVSEVKKDFTDSIVIHLRSSNPFMSIDAHVEDSETAKAAQLNKGDTVTLRCEGRGMVIGRPQLGDCLVE